MKFWLSGEDDADVSEKIRILSLKLEKKLNKYFKDRKYGLAINEWDYMTIIMSEDYVSRNFFKEIVKYDKTSKETEFRLKIDHKKFLKADDTEAIKLVAESMLRSVDLAEEKFRVKDFDFKQFRSDLKSFFKDVYHCEL